MSNDEKKQLKKNKKFEKEKLKEKKDFYNYKYWREVQRNQLGVSANLYFIFSSAIFGYILNFLMEKNNILFYEEKFFLITSLIFLLISLIFYSIFTENRLQDFRDTANNIDKSLDYDEIRKLTESIGKRSWNLYDKQRCFLILGFGFSLIGFLLYIF